MAPSAVEEASTAPHFVLVPLMAQGHMIPMVDLARLLAEGGARVSLITTPVNRARIQGLVDRVKRAKLAIEFVELPFPPTELGLPDGCENIDLIVDNNHFLPFFEGMRTLQGPLEGYLRAQTQLPSCLIADWCNPWTADVARNTGIPRLFFHGPSCFYSLCDLNAATHGLFDSVADYLEPYIVPGMPVRVVVTKATGPGFFNIPGWEKLRDDANEAVRTADGVVVNTFRELEAEFIACYEAALGKPVWALGPFCLCNRDVEAMASRGNRADVDKNVVLTWLDAMAPESVVYVSFGSIVRKRPLQLFEIGYGLEASGKPFVWVVRESDAAVPEVQEWLKSFEERTEEKGLVVRGWAPQLAILAHRAVGGFVTHCGWNSMLEAITLGMPIVTWPHFSDQFLNERLAVDVLGISVPIGAKMPVHMIDEEVEPVRREDIQKAVSALVDGGKEGEDRRAKARELGKKAHKAMEKGGSSYANLSQLIESFMRNGSKNMDVTSRELQNWQNPSTTSL